MIRIGEFFLNGRAIKFKFDIKHIDEYAIGNVFNNAGHILNYQFDEDYNVHLVDSDVNYQFKDVSNVHSEDIEAIASSFFNFTFEDVFNVFLYKFLVLKDIEKLTVLAIIDSAIFDYSSINDFYELFHDVNANHLSNNLEVYYDDVNDYLNSPDFDEDSVYWKNFTLNASDYIKFHNLKSNNYKFQKIVVDEGSVSTFIENQDSSIFEFYASVFALYLCRIDRLDGCLLKTGTSLKRKDLNVFNKTILKIDFNNGESFVNYLHQFDSSYDDAVNHAKVSVENYLSEDLSYYSVYDFSDLDGGVCIYNGEDSALTLNIHEDYLELAYNSDLFSDVYIEHMARNIENLVSNIINSPNQLIGDIDILSNEEKDLLADFCKGESALVDENNFLSHAFRAKALEYPDVVAVDDGINKVTFGELEKSSNSIAYDLKANYNIGHGSRVALMLPRTYHFPELVLALNKIGATFIPVDLFYPLKRIEYMLNVSRAEYIVTTESVANSFGLKEGIILIEDLNDSDYVDIDIETNGDELFTIIFTSGTTGLPKGVMVSNSQIPGLGISFKEIFNYSRGDVIGHYLGFTFVASFVLYAALVFGGSCRIFNEQEQKDSLLLVKELKENHMNSLILPPGIGIPIYENEDLQLDYLVLAGAKLNKLSNNEKHTKLVNFYGTTEIICGVTKIFDLKDIEEGNVSLGRPVANSWVYILDKNNNQMPIGVPGEICVSSKYISQGYLDNPDLTNEVFIDNPHCIGEGNERLYRTGDIGFYNFDGEIEIIGREDNQLSVRGFRVESDEILSIMGNFSEISDVYLDVENDTLISYYTASDDLDIDEVKKELNINLPYYMVPSLFIELDEIHLSANGKIDKDSLKKSMVDYNVEIADEVLQCVVDAFKEVLNLDSVLVDDDFVALGGNSLSAMKLQLLLKERLNVYLSSNELMDISTPQEIANYIKYNLNVHSAVDEDRYTFDEPCPLSESQLNIYLDESVKDMGTSYNNPFKIDFRDNYSVDEIKDALIKLFEVFPILKARVLNEKGTLSFVFDGEPEIIEGSANDIVSFVNPFEFDKYLSRFLISVDDESVILCADFHHLIFDGTSVNILLKRLSSILDCEDVDFVDRGVLRQASFEEIKDSEYRADAKAFFDEMLADRDEVHDLLPSVDGDDGEYVLIDTFDMDDECLSSFLQSHSITYNQFFTSIFGYTLSRFSGSEKVLFNIVEDGRGHIDLSESVGMFVKTLPVLMDCKNQEISSFLDYSSNLVNSVMKYDLYPFRVLASEHDLNSSVLFQYSHDIFSDVINKQDSKYVVDELVHDLDADLSFNILNNGEDRLTIRILYSSIYSKSFIKHFAESYKLILNEMIKVGELKDIDYISDEDVEILDAYNQTEHQLSYNDILDAFNVNLSKFPKNNLVSYEDNVYSYEEGAFIADAISSKLKAMGVEKEEAVAFLVERSELYMFSVLGILSVGAVYVPLDDALPDERIKFILENISSRVVIVSDETCCRVEQLYDDAALLNISEILKKDIGSLSQLSVSYSDLACILYTSGSTGVPKGVKVTRKSVVNAVVNYVDKYGLHIGDVHGLFASIGFDVANFVIASVLYAGACLSVIPEGIRLNMFELNRYFVENDVTHSFITTQVGKLFVQNIQDTSLDVLLVGGEKLGEFESPDNYCLVDIYGPTEAFAYISLIDNSDKVDYSSVGLWNYNTKCYILDGEGRRVPLGAVGELCIAGHQIAEGYLNLEEETQKAFVNNPFDCGDYGVLYRTGDMVRLLPDGSLGIVGRNDSQVKIRGNRVELSEIEHVIHQIEYVEDLTVQTIKNNGNNELVAYVVVSSDISEVELRELICGYVGEYKLEYMVPSFVISLDEIPLNVNGKVDRSALPDVDLDSLHMEYVAPNTEEEKVIVEAFEKVFNDKVGIYDDFVRLGGDSLTAIKLASYLDGYNITVADILSLHTPYAIAKNIKKIEFDLDFYTLDSGCPLNESQLNVYLDIVLNKKYDAYIIPLFMKISKKYEISEIHDALIRMFEVHPILSMRISDEFEVPYLVKGSLPSIIVEDNVGDDFITESLGEPFDLQDSLCRFLIVDENDDYKLFATFNHIIFDALSIDVFKQDLQSLLDGDSVDVDDSFLKVAAFSQQIQGTDEYRDAEDFFESMLGDNEEGNILIESVDGGEAGQLKIDLEIDNNLLKSFLERHSVSENVLFTSAFAYTLSRFTGYENASFNIVENGRDRFNNFNSIGMYVNTLPILADCKNQSIASFMEHMAGLIYDVMRYNYYPFRLLANEYHVSSDILFQFFPEWIDDVEFNKNLPLNVDQNDIMASRDNLIANFSVKIIQRGKDYNLDIMYCDKYSNAFVEHFAESFKLILHQIIDVEKLEEINYVTSEDIELLDKFNQAERPLVYNDVLDAFNDNLIRCPDNNLVSCKDAVYSYAEGAFIADRIAKCLVDCGVGPGDCVGFLTERSEHYMFSVLGILSMGGVYVPLDDKYPDERIGYMLRDVGSKVIIVSDETYGRAKELAGDNLSLLNISDILKEDVGSLSSLPVVYGDLACILYTSGSTGRPKGVKITRKAILNFVEFYVEDSGIGDGDVYGLFASIGFDVAIKGIFSSIFSGACLNVVPDEIKLNMHLLNDYFMEYGVTYTHITSQVAKLFMSNVIDSSLKSLVTGGEKLGEVEYPQNYQLIDTYGPTEACVYVTSIDEIDKIDSSSVGNLLNNTKAYILDAEKRRVPFGAVGELCLSGYQIAEGYLNLQNETREAFENNPFDENDDYATLYHTGDMARLLPDGSIAIIGRRDGQVKIRGNRVELSEVESVVRELDYVDDVTVQTIKNNGNYELAVYIVASGDVGEDSLKDDIQDYVREHKPEYMVPSFVISLDKIPLNVNGKVDKRALPDVDMSSLHAEYVAPRNENEKEIVKAFEKALKVENIGIYDDFIRLGGDSLTGIKLLSYIDSNEVTMADIFSFRTPEAIAKNMDGVSFDLDIYTLESGCPLNAAQVNVFTDVTVYNKKNSYQIPGFIPISKEYGLENILSSLDKLLDAHPIFSMHLVDEYESNDDAYVGDLDVLKDLIGIAKKVGIMNAMDMINSFGLRDIGGLYNMLRTIIRVFKGRYPYIVKGDKPPVSVESSVDTDIIVDFFAKSLNLHNYLAKFMIVESEESYYVLYLIHHIIFDAISSGLFRHDLQVLLDGGSLDLDDVFLKTSAFTHQIKNTEKFNEAREFYRPILSDAGDVGELVPDNSSEGYNISYYELEFDKVAFKSFLNKAGISENILFTSVFTYALSQFVDGDKVLFTLIENGRDRFPENFIGMTSNVMPLVADCKDRSINSFMEDMSDLVYGASRYSYYPLIHLYQKYDFEVKNMFQFVPNWIADDVGYVETVEGIDVEELINQVFKDYSDFLAEFLVQIYQYGENYRLILTNSKRYSDYMINDFKDTFASVLSNIINADTSSNLSDTLK